MKTMKKRLAIIGAGPAGMAAAIDAQNARLDFILIDNDEIGWYAKYSINQHYKVDGYLGAYDTTGTELIDNFVKHLKVKNVTVTKTRVMSIEKNADNFVISCDDCIILSQFVIIATGTIPAKLYVENFDRFFGKYIFNFVCKEDIELSNKKIVVLGGRNSGATTAIYLSGVTDSPITLLEKSVKLNATPKYLERLAKTPVKCVTNANLISINGINEMESINVEIAQKIQTIPCNLLFCCIGMKPNTKMLKGLPVEVDSDGRIVVNPITMETSVQNLYAIGDINQLLPKQVSNATANGKTAVYFINRKY